MKRNKRYLFLLMILLFFLHPINVFAGEKSIEIPFSKDYQSVTFNITTTEEGKYKASLTSPKGTKYECVTIDSTTITCTIKKVEKGTWYVTIIDESKTVMPKFSVSVEADTSHSSDVVDETISVKSIMLLSTLLV